MMWLGEVVKRGGAGHRGVNRALSLCKFDANFQWIGIYPGATQWNLHNPRVLLLSHRLLHSIHFFPMDDGCQSSMIISITIPTLWHLIEHRQESQSISHPALAVVIRHFRFVTHNLIEIEGGRDMETGFSCSFLSIIEALIMMRNTMTNRNEAGGHVIHLRRRPIDGARRRSPATFSPFIALNRSSLSIFLRYSIGALLARVQTSSKCDCD